MTWLRRIADLWPFCLKRAVDQMRIRLNAEVEAKREAQRALLAAQQEIRRYKTLVALSGMGKEQAK